MQKEWSTFLFIFFPLVKSNERQMNCLPLMISHEWNHAEPVHVSCAQHLEVTYAWKKLNTNRSCSWLSSAVSVCLIFHWLDLLMDFYCRNRCWTRKEIFDCFDWDVTDLKKVAAANFVFIIFFIFYISEFIVTIHCWCELREIRIWVKRKKKRRPRPRPRPPMKFSFDS